MLVNSVLCIGDSSPKIIMGIRGALQSQDAFGVFVR
jgi:hypothetical protein